MARTTISIPDNLKKRMDKVREPVNWSAIAANAFELKLGEIARKQQEKTVEAVVQRLRASKLQSLSRIEAEGREVGIEWAKKYAEWNELERVAQINSDEWFSGPPNAPFCWADYLAFEIQGTNRDELDRSISEDFWYRSLGDSRDKRLDSEEFLGGFVAGAVEVFEEVENKL
jgi:hypothetical protein